MDIERRRKTQLEHYYRKPRKPCPICGKPILIESKGCRKHTPYPTGEQSSNWKGGAGEAKKRFQMNHPFYCIDCGIRVSNYSSRCPKCSLKYLGPKNWKGGRIKQKGGYIKLLNRDHPEADGHGYIWEHRFIWEQIHARPIPKGWIIHHLNGIKGDNRSVNLVALPNHKHYLVLQAKATRIQELEALLNGQGHLF